MANYEDAISALPYEQLSTPVPAELKAALQLVINRVEVAENIGVPNDIRTRTNSIRFRAQEALRELAAGGTAATTVARLQNDIRWLKYDVLGEEVTPEMPTVIRMPPAAPSRNNMLVTATALAGLWWLLSGKA